MTSPQIKTILTEKIGAIIDRHIAPIFKPGAKFTVLARHPGFDDADVVVTSDDDAGVLEIVGRQFPPLATKEGAGVPVAWQERQKNLMGWTSWYESRSTCTVGKTAQFGLVAGGIPYEFRPLYAAPTTALPAAQIADERAHEILQTMARECDDWAEGLNEDPTESQCSGKAISIIMRELATPPAVMPLADHKSANVSDNESCGSSVSDNGHAVMPAAPSDAVGSAALKQWAWHWFGSDADEEWIAEALANLPRAAITQPTTVQQTEKGGA